MDTNLTIFNLISACVLGILLVLFLITVLKKAYDNKLIFYTMFLLVVAHAALTLTVSFTAPDTLLDKQVVASASVSTA